MRPPVRIKAPPAEVAEAADPTLANKPALFQRIWPPGDEIQILKALAKHRRRHGYLPLAAKLFASLNGRFEKKDVNRKGLANKLRSLERRYSRDVNKAAPPPDKHERRLYNLSIKVWGPRIQKSKSPTAESLQKPSTAAQEKSAGEPIGNDGDPQPQGKSADDEAKFRTFDEMRELYPCLVHEAMFLVVDLEVLKRVLPGIDDNKAQELDKAIQKIRKQITKAITEPAQVKNMEIPIIRQSTKLEQGKIAEKENNLVEPFDKTDVSVSLQERLAQVEHEMEKLKQIIMPSQSEAKISCDNSMAKRVRSESAASGVRSIVVENQISLNMLQNKTKGPNHLSRRKNMEVTSRYRHNPPANNKQQKMPLPSQKIATGCQSPQNVDCFHERNAEGEQEVVLLSIKRPYAPVAKAILQSSSQSKMIGDKKLGTQYCKVFVKEVLQSEALMINEYGDMTKMAHALKRSIVWPRGQIRLTMVADMGAPDQQSHQGC